MLNYMLMTRKPRRKSAYSPQATPELDSVYLLKLVLYLIVGTQWLWIQNPAGTSGLPLPVGLVAGFVFARHDHFQIDRKIEYAILLIALFIGFYSHIGLYITR